MFKLDACKIVFPGRDIVTCPRTGDGFFYINARALLTNDNMNDTKCHETIRTTKIGYELKKFYEPTDEDGQKIIGTVSTQSQRDAAIPNEESTDKPSADINGLHAKFGHESEKVIRATMWHLGIRVKGIMKL